MALKQLVLKNLDKINGGIIAAAFDKEVQRMALDCEDRPGDKTARTVTLVVKMVPVLVQRDCERLKTTVHVKSASPEYKTGEIDCGLRREGMVTFNPDSEDNVNQGTLLEDEED